MSRYLSAKETARKWAISQRRVALLCAEGRVAGAMKVGNCWIIPEAAEKPRDLRCALVEQTPMPTLKPFVKWVGGKCQSIGEIESVLRQSKRGLTRYCEPMVGGGAFFFYALSKGLFDRYYIGDCNAALINTYKVIQCDVEALIAKLSEMQSAYLPLDDSGRKYYYYTIRDKYNHLPLTDAPQVEKAAYFIFLNKTCFNGLYRVNRKGEYNVPMGAYKNPHISDAENLRNISRAMGRVTIECGDYSQCLSFVDKRTFVYLDPPYRPISPTAMFTSYNADAFDDAEQVRLFRFFRQLTAVGALVALSNSDPKNTDTADDFFDTLYAGFTIKRVEASRMVNSKAENRGKIKELLIHN